MNLRTLVVWGLLALLGPTPAFALDGQVGIHDPSTIVRCDGKFYTWGTGGRGLVSADGWTWERGGTYGGGGLAPDVIHLGDRYYLYYAVARGQPRAEIHVTSNKTLDPQSPDYKWEEGGVVAGSDGIEDCNAIDPGVFHDPNDGRLWLTYGSYFGFIRLVELDAKTGKRLRPDEPPIDLAVNCEASIMIHRDGWYYLLATHGSCCAGADSGYNIRVGRSRKVTGPFLDHEGVDMIQGGGKLFLGSEGRFIGPGHFGLLDLGEGVQKFSCHYEADLDRGGASVMDVRPLLWRDGWPAAGENVKEGTYRIESARTGTALELAVEGVPVGGRRRGGFGGGGGRGGPGAAGGPGGGNAPGGANAPGSAGGPGAGRGGAGGGGPFGGTGGGPIPPQDAAQVMANWPAGTAGVRLANYMSQAQQKWTVAPAAGAGGYPGSPYFKITVAGTDRALAATEDGELVAAARFDGSPEQLWRIDQLADGTYRIMPKAIPHSKDSLALSAIGNSSPTLAKFDPAGEKYRWLLKAP